MKIINQIRIYQINATMGEIYVGDKRVAYSLEDPRSPTGVKIPGITCIPEGAYIAKVTRSPRFGKDMILLCSEGKDGIIRDGMTFTGIRVHSGNTVDDTEACILAGEHTNHIDKIWACKAVNELLLEIVKTHQPCLWVISSK